MITFIERESGAFHDYDMAMLIPTYMVKDGVEYFLMNRRVSPNRHSLDQYQNNKELEAAKAMLTANGGKFAKFFGRIDCPLEMLRIILEKGYTFEWPDDLFVQCEGEPYGGGFVDFCNNCRGLAEFYYRIYDAPLVKAIQEKVAGIPPRTE